MDQSITHTQHRNTAAQKRASWFVGIIVVLMICAAVGVATTVIRSAETSMSRDVERTLTTQGQSKVSAITVWYGGLQSQVERLGNADMFRLFASEVNGLGTRLSHLLRLADNDTQAAEDDELSQLASQLPLMRNLLREFVSLSRHVSARMLNGQSQTYLTTEDNPVPLTPVQLKGIRDVLDSGISIALPVRATTTHGLVMDIVYPIFAPHYVDSPSDRPAAALILTVPITDKVNEFSAPSLGAEAESTHILQVNNGTLQEMLPQSTDSLRTLPNWQLNADRSLPMAIRTLPDSSTPVYLLGLGVPQLDWVVAQDISVQVARQPLHTYRNMIITAAVVATGIVILLLGLVWWWLVGRRERAISSELTQLYQTVNEQRQLLDGINSTLTDGIVLTDQQGIIIYANQGFADMVGRTPETLAGLDGEAVFGYDTARRIRRHAEQVLETARPVTFADVLWLRSQKNHYQVTCAPYMDDTKSILGVVSVYHNITELVETQQRNQTMVQQTVSVLMRAIEAVDPYLRGQSAQTGQLAGYICQRMNLTAEDETTIRTAANLFQIGMLRLPRELLNKTGPLTPEERTQLQRHVEYACAALEGIDFGLNVLEVITQMHECMDGSGYPNHLRGDQIGMHARILSVANSFCALVRPRAYRQAKTVDEALDILSMEPPKFDPHVVNILRELLRTSVGEKFMLGLRGEDTSPV